VARFYVQRGDETFGPFESLQLKQLADSGRVTASDMIRRGEDGKWYPASEVKGLFVGEPVEQMPASLPPAPGEETQSATDNPNLHACRDCGKMVSRRATTCPSCGAPLYIRDVIAEARRQDSRR
jgi:hypothetical protein